MKILTRIFLPLALLILLCVPAHAANFTDTAGHVHEAAISRAVDEGIICGYNDGTFRPNAKVTRAEFCAMINRTLGVSGSAPLNFRDVAVTDWYYKDVRSAVTVGYILGMPNDLFEPDGMITRYQAALILHRLAAMPLTRSVAYSDAADIPDWAKDGVRFAANYQIFDDFVTDTFDGQRALTRAECACALLKMLDTLPKYPVFFSLVTADDAGRELNTTTLYKNENAKLHFLVSGRGIAKGFDVPENSDTSAYLAAMTAAREKLTQNLAFTITGAVGAATLDYAGNRTKTPAFRDYRVLDDNTFLFTVVLDRADYLPAWLTAAVRLPAGSSLAATHTLRASSVFVKYTAIGEYLMSADSPRLLFRAITAKHSSKYSVRRLLSWKRSPYVYNYSVDVYVCDAGGNIREETRTAYTGTFVNRGSRVEVDLTDYIREPAASYGADAYQVVEVTAVGRSAAHAFYPSAFSLSAGSYVRLTLDGKSVEQAAVVKKNGVALELRDLSFSSLAGDGFTCTTEITVLNGSYNDMTGKFAWASSDAPVPLGKPTDITALVQDSTLKLGSLTTNGAEKGFYTVLLRLDIGTKDKQNTKTIYLSGALVVE